MTGRLDGKVAAITGSASGFGEAAARLFVAEGARVALGDIQVEAGRAIADDLGEAARFIECDVTSEDDVAALADLAVDNFGQLDVMFNNAGIVGARGPIDQIPAPEWEFTIDVLLHGVFYGMKHAARVMKPRHTGSIISMASTAGVIGGLGPHAYAAAKHAVVGLTKNAGAELCRFGIRVNCIAPHSMAT
ncbi:MAG: SDR family oxidoreductase, partial [bacterium]|nr:SDR family oxidoreductase [bacterium]